MSAGLLRVCTAGSVDDGKSTLIGRLLYDAKGVYDDQVMTILRKTEKGVITRETLPVRFVPMVKKRD